MGDLILFFSIVFINLNSTNTSVLAVAEIQAVVLPNTNSYPFAVLMSQWLQIPCPSVKVTALLTSCVVFASSHKLVTMRFLDFSLSLSWWSPRFDIILDVSVLSRRSSLVQGIRNSSSLGGHTGKLTASAFFIAASVCALFTPGRASDTRESTSAPIPLATYCVSVSAWLSYFPADFFYCQISSTLDTVCRLANFFSLSWHENMLLGTYLAVFGCCLLVAGVFSCSVAFTAVLTGVLEQTESFLAQQTQLLLKFLVRKRFIFPVANVLP